VSLREFRTHRMVSPQEQICHAWARAILEDELKKHLNLAKIPKTSSLIFRLNAMELMELAALPK